MLKRLPTDHLQRDMQHALDMAVQLGVVGRNVTDAVQVPKASREERRAWSHVLAHRKAKVINTISEMVLGGEPGSGADDLRTTPSAGIESSSDL